MGCKENETMKNSIGTLSNKLMATDIQIDDMIDDTIVDLRICARRFRSVSLIVMP